MNGEEEGVHKLHVLLSQAAHRTTVNPKWNTTVEQCSSMCYCTLWSRHPLSQFRHSHSLATEKSAYGGQGFHFLKVRRL